MRDTIRKAAQSLGAEDVLALLDATPDADLITLLPLLFEIGGKQLQTIGAELKRRGHKSEGARAEAEGRFYSGGDK